jgi:hypothetical protein
MPPKKGTSTPNKTPDSPTWTLDEGEEMCRDINDFQKKTITKDDLQGMMDGLKRENHGRIEKIPNREDT